MAEFEAYPDNLMQQADEMKKLAAQIEQYGRQIRSISKSLGGIGNESYDMIKSVLNTLSEEVIQAKKSAESMGDGLIACAKEYKSTEKKIESAAPRDFSLHIHAEGSGPSSTAEAGIKEENGSHIASASASASAGKGETNVTFGDGFYDFKGTGYLPGAEAAALAGYTANDDTLEAYAKASASAYGLKGEAEQDQCWGLSKYKASGEVLSANAEAKAYASLSHNGIAVPSIGAEGEAKASVASGEAEHTVGLEKYNVHAGAEGYVVGAEANAEAKFGAMDDGSYGVALGAEAGAYLAKGEVSAGFTICGIEVDVKLGGNIGAGGKAGVSLESDSVELSAGLSAILGVEAEVSIDWSDIGW